jgi:hypothetical protein
LQACRIIRRGYEMMYMVLKVLSIHVDGILNITQPSLPDIM